MRREEKKKRMEKLEEHANQRGEDGPSDQAGTDDEGSSKHGTESGGESSSQRQSKGVKSSNVDDSAEENEESESEQDSNEHSEGADDLHDLPDEVEVKEELIRAVTDEWKEYETLKRANEDL